MSEGGEFYLNDKMCQGLISKLKTDKLCLTTLIHDSSADDLGDNTEILELFCEYFITIKNFLLFSNTSNNLIMFTWTKVFRMSTSWRIFILEKSFFIYILSIHLIATKLSVSISLPRWTFPKAPFPISFFKS